MRLPSSQRGLGMWGWLFMLAAVGGVMLLTLQLVPVFLNEMAVQRVVKQTADDQNNAGLDPASIRRAMQRRWDVEQITHLDSRDVKLVRTSNGRALAYEYEVRVKLFKNLSVVAEFKNEFPMKGAGGSVSD